MYKAIGILALICLISLAAAKYECNITGWPSYYKNQYMTKCGYLSDPLKGYNYHYVYVNKSLSALNPLIIKVGGGNGESSKVGLFEEMGPYLWDIDGSFSQKENPYTWAQKAHLLFIDAPLETGYSYLPPKVDPYIYNDDNTTAFLTAAIISFLTNDEYKALKNSRIFFQGQDNAAMYLPKVADNLLRKYNYNIEGLMLGNPILNVQDNCDPESPRLPNTTLQYFANREYLSPQLNRIWSTQQACQRSGYAAPRCKYLINRIHSILDGINLYDINNKCFSDLPQKKSQDKSKRLKHELKPHCYPICRKDLGKDKYLNDPVVIANMNAVDLKTAGRESYEIFNEETFGLYAEHDPGAEEVIDVLVRLIKNDTDVVIYSGLNDGDIPHNLVELYVQQIKVKLGAYSLGMKPFYCKALKPDNAPLGGWAEQFSFDNGGFTYLRVKGAGRWVPAHFPEAGYEIMVRTTSETDPW